MPRNIQLKNVFLQIQKHIYGLNCECIKIKVEEHEPKKEEPTEEKDTKPEQEPVGGKVKTHFEFFSTSH